MDRRIAWRETAGFAFAAEGTGLSTFTPKQVSGTVVLLTLLTLFVLWKYFHAGLPR